MRRFGIPCDGVTIRIRSERTWPEKIVLNTNQAMILLTVHRCGADRAVGCAPVR